jgi:hypothetical protein
MDTSLLVELGIAIALLALLAGAFTFGKRMGRRHPDEHPHLGVLQGATLGLMGLLLGFSYSGAMSRLSDRQKLISEQANTISTVWLRSQVSTDDAGAAIRRSLREYASAMPQAFERPRSQAFIAAQTTLDSQERDMWNAGLSMSRTNPQHTMVILPVLNQMFDLRASRIAATSVHLPLPVGFALLACATISVGTIGYGMAGGRKALVPPAWALVGLLAIVLWVVLDMDYPRYGFIRVSDEPLRAVAESLK